MVYDFHKPSPHFVSCSDLSEHSIISKFKPKIPHSSFPSYIIFPEILYTGKTYFSSYSHRCFCKIDHKFSNNICTLKLNTPLSISGRISLFPRFITSISFYSRNSLILKYAPPTSIYLFVSSVYKFVVGSIRLG